MQPTSRPRYVDAWQDARLLAGLFEVVARALSVTAEVFLRRGFGERYLTTGLVLAGASVILPLAGGLSGVEIGQLAQTSPGALLYLGSFIAFAAGRRGEVIRRSRSGGAWYSWSDGTPWRTWGRIGVSPAVARAFGEPLLVLAVAAAAIGAGDPVFATFLVAISAAMFLKEQRMMIRRREAWLDAQDRRIEDEELSAMLLGVKNPGARGCVISGLDGLPRTSRIELVESLRAESDPVLSESAPLRSTSSASSSEEPVAPLASSAVPLADAERHTEDLPVHEPAIEESLPTPRTAPPSPPGPAPSSPSSPSSSSSSTRAPETNGVVSDDAVPVFVALDADPVDLVREEMPAADSGESAWVDAFATFRSRARASRRVLDGRDPWNIEA